MFAMIACAGGLWASPGAAHFAGIEPTADGKHLRVRMYDGGYDAKDYPSELIPGHPDAYPASGIYRRGEKTPLFTDDGDNLPFGPYSGERCFVAPDGSALLWLKSLHYEPPAVEYRHASGKRVTHELPGRALASGHTEFARRPWWHWEQAGGQAIAVSQSGDRYAFSPGTGELLRVQRAADSMPTPDEVAAFEAALGSVAPLPAAAAIDATPQTVGSEPAEVPASPNRTWLWVMAAVVVLLATAFIARGIQRRR